MGIGALQPGHLIVILVIVLLIFGPSKLPSLGRAVGDSLRELKRATGSGDDTPPASNVTALPTTRACPSCRQLVPTADKFCGHCGGSIEAVPRSA